MIVAKEVTVYALFWPALLLHNIVDAGSHNWVRSAYVEVSLDYDSAEYAAKWT